MENSDGRRKFAIAGVAGYIAPRHLGAIHALRCELTTAHDLPTAWGSWTATSPGRTSPRTGARSNGSCARRSHFELPHGLHSQPHLPPHAGGARRGPHVICENPLGLTPGEIDRMIEAERSSGAATCGPYCNCASIPKSCG